MRFSTDDMTADCCDDDDDGDTGACLVSAKEIA